MCSQAFLNVDLHHRKDSAEGASNIISAAAWFRRQPVFDIELHRSSARNRCHAGDTSHHFSQPRNLRPNPITHGELQMRQST